MQKIQNMEYEKLNGALQRDYGISVSDERVLQI